MSRLFVTQRELNFISDITKEVIKDVVGNFVYYYPISEIKTKVHDLYNEAVQKVFDNPIKLDALVDTTVQSETKINQFGIDREYRLEVYVQHRDLVDKGIRVNVGDFFSFSDVFYEITEATFMRNIYGMPDHKDGVKISGVRARQGLFSAPLKGPTDIRHADDDAVQTTFVQQRGQVENSEGPTGDVRELQKQGVLDAPLSGPKEVSGRGDDGQGAGSSFYDDE